MHFKMLFERCKNSVYHDILSGKNAWFMGFCSMKYRKHTLHSFSKSKFLFTRLVLKYLKKGSARFLILSQWDILECKSFTLWEIASWLIGAYLKILSLKCWEFSLLLQQWYLNSAVATKNCELLTQNYWDLICWEQRRPEQLR